MQLLNEICFALAKHRTCARKPGDVGHNPATFDIEAYQAWRETDLRRQLMDNFRPSELAGLDVLDFGCGSGELSWLVAALGVRSITGIDLDGTVIERARAAAPRLRDGVQPRFICATSAAAIDLPDASMDAILCFDVLEHVLHYQEIAREWRRVLRPGGRVLIWWVPWLHPYGHHLESLIPVPWAHVLWSEDVLIETCARIYELPSFQPRVWDLEPDGRRKPNKWRTMHELPCLNRLTIRRFEATCRRVGLRVERRAISGFAGSRAARLTSVLTHVPVLREFFASCVVYQLRSEASVSGGCAPS